MRLLLMLLCVTAVASVEGNRLLVYSILAFILATGVIYFLFMQQLLILSFCILSWFF